MKKEFYKKSLESNADFKSTSCENILSKLYSLVYTRLVLSWVPRISSHNSCVQMAADLKFGGYDSVVSILWKEDPFERLSYSINRNVSYVKDFCNDFHCQVADPLLWFTVIGEIWYSPLLLQKDDWIFVKIPD